MNIHKSFDKIKDLRFFMESNMTWPTIHSTVKNGKRTLTKKKHSEAHAPIAFILHIYTVTMTVIVLAQLYSVSYGGIYIYV